MYGSKTIAFQSVLQILTYMPYSIQAQVCNESYEQVKDKAANIIKRNMIYHNKRIKDLVEMEIGSVAVHRSFFAMTYPYYNKCLILYVIQKTPNKFSSEVLNIVNESLNALQGIEPSTEYTIMAARYCNQVLQKLSFDELMFIGY